MIVIAAMSLVVFFCLSINASYTFSYGKRKTESIE